MNASAGFWDRIAARYARKPVPDEAVYRRKLEITRGYLRADMVVLELGCGTGSTAIAHAPYVRHVRAIDVSSRMLGIARGKAAAESVGNVTFEQSTIEAIEVPEGSIDAVLGLSILHLLADREAAIAKVHAMLKPGGVFVTSTVCLGDTMRFFRFVAPIGSFLGLIPMVYVFTRRELLDALLCAGFAIDHEWQPGKGDSVFVVARRTGPARAAKGPALAGAPAPG